ncbi:MAG: hypothetical protein ACE5OZ_25775 [Candidatus Heimdallarchaeota archaeon]
MPEKTLCPNCGTPYFPEDEFCSSCGDPIPKFPPPQETKPRDSPIITNQRIEDLKGYVQMIGIVEIVFGALALVLGIFSLVAAVFVPLIMMDEDVAEEVGSETSLQTDNATLAIFVGVLIFVFAVLVILYGIMAVINGKRLLEYQRSGRTGTMIIAAISLINFPIGTLFGAAALYVLTQPGAEELFS